MKADVREYVKTCDLCQRIRVHRHSPYGKLEPLPVPQEPGDVMSMDFITSLPPSNYDGKVYDAILVVVDALTKYTLYVPCRKDIDAPMLAQLVFRNVVPLMGNPKRLITDRGSLFISNY